MSEQEIKQIEIEWGDAFERRDMDALDRFMADEYILTDPLGNVRTITRWAPALSACASAASSATG